MQKLITLNHGHSLKSKNSSNIRQYRNILQMVGQKRQLICIIHIIFHNQVGLVMSISYRQTAFSRPDMDLSPMKLGIDLTESQDYLRQNLGSEDRMMDLHAKNAEHYINNNLNGNRKNGTLDTKQKNGNGKEMVTWPDQYKKTRGMQNVSSSIFRVQQEILSPEQTTQRINNAKIQLNQTKQLQKPLEEAIQSIPGGNNNIFQHQQMIKADQINFDVSPVGPLTDRPKNEVEMAYQRAIKQSKQSQDNKSESSQNIFDLFKNKKKARVLSESQNSASRESSNIFDELKRKSRKPTESNPSSSESDQQNIFQKKKIQNTLLKTSHIGKYTLEQIVQSSKMYHNYLIATQRKYIKKISLDIPQLKQTRKHSHIPKEYFFKPDRVQFKKMINQPYGESSYNNYLYLCRINNDRTRFYFQDLRSQQLKNLNAVQCTKLSFIKQDNISPHTEYDHIFQRFYLFSNTQQKILVFSQLSMQLLCKIPVQKQVTSPNIHFCHINGRNFLILIGGYIRVQKQIAQGNNSIEIFEVNKWFLNPKSRIIKLIIGRINPIFITSKIKSQHKFLILGGNAIAKIVSEGVFDFKYEKDINESTNMTGISINCKQITQIFDYEQHTNISNVSVKILDPFCLHSGIVLTLSNNFLLALPGSLNLFQIKIFHKEINIIEARGSVFFNTVQQYQKRELSLKIQRQKMIIYSIDDKGMFHISSQEGKKIEKCRCSIY